MVRAIVATMVVSAVRANSGCDDLARCNGRTCRESWVLIANALIGIAVTIHAQLDDLNGASGVRLASHAWPGA